jgi:transketolase
VPWDLGFEAPAIERLEPGRGTVLREGGDATIVATGPVLVSQAMAAAQALSAEGVDVGVVALPWLRDIDGAWLADVSSTGAIVVLDNHLRSGGQGDAVLGALGDHAGRVIKHAVDEVPVCGTNDEVLAHHRLDAAGIAGILRSGVAAGSAA